MSAPVQPMNTPPASHAAALLDYAWWLIAAVLLVTTLGLAGKAIADRNSDREPDGVLAALIASGAASAVALVVAVVNSFGASVLDVFSAAWSVCIAAAPYLACLAALATLPFFWRYSIPPPSTAPKVSLVKATRPVDLATELGKAARLLPEDEHLWWVTVQAPVLLAAELAAIYTAER